MSADASSVAPAWSRRARVVSALLPALLFVGLYARSLPYDFVWTDRTEIVQGLVIRPPERILHALVEPMYVDLAVVSPGSVQPYYRPLKVVVLSTVDWLFGREPAAFRAVSLVLGALAFAVLALLVGLLFGDARIGGLVGLLAAAHPAAIENHVWAAGIDDALAKLFVLASLLATVAAARARSGARSIGLGGLALFLLALGLGSKESAVVTPVLAAVCLWLAGGPGGGPRRTAFGVVGSQVLLVGVYALVVRPLVLGGVASGVPPIGGRYALHLVTILATWPDRIAWTFLPLESSTSDVVDVVHVILAPPVVLGVVLALSMPVVVWGLRRLGRRAAALGWAWLWICFLPASGLVPLSHLRADRFLALSSLGACLVLAAVVLGIAGRRRVVAVVLTAVTVGGFAGLTSARLPDWRSDLVLFSRDVERDPFFREGRYVRAVALFESGRYEEARTAIHELEEVNRNFAGRVSFLRQDTAATLLCEINLELGSTEETVELLGAQLRPDSPALGVSPSFFLCGARSLEAAGRTGQALALYRALASVRGFGGNPRVQLGLARVHAQLGDRRAARLHLGRTPSRIPGDPDFAESRRALERRLGGP